MLSPFGKVETDRKISGEVREIDVCFFPHSKVANLPSLGLLSKLASTGVAFEPFRNPVNADEIRSCEAKLHKVQQRAIDEINRLDPNSPYRQNALKLLSDLMVGLDARQNQNNRETELLMSLRTSAIYLQQVEKIGQQARTAGEQQLVLKMLTRKLGSVSPELTAKVNELSLDRLETLGEDLLDFQAVSDLEKWLE